MDLSHLQIKYKSVNSPANMNLLALSLCLCLCLVASGWAAPAVVEIEPLNLLDVDGDLQVERSELSESERVARGLGLGGFGGGFGGLGGKFGGFGGLGGLGHGFGGGFGGHGFGGGLGHGFGGGLGSFKGLFSKGF
ncbi:glycine-rich RNA-binding protein blt801 [Drosophila mojavensis]|uniref:DUF4766 domain-containing protein n=1 Tax=Drosophila mojavensis TaxID=7230 RepID=B4KRN1_DROMO|nr:glycine-rich RNA-binding protein blt801 [Drosophila mojavensis]EDW08301.2 uncharacterized protein Dmoj_GI19659 [Drosophila mojavensis]